jgi:6-phosphogluconolactonase
MSEDPTAKARFISAAYRATQGLVGGRVITPTVDALIDLLGQDLMSCALRRVDEAGVFHLALSGGSSPQALYQRLMIDPQFRGMPWVRTHLWIVDERVVPFDDERNNFKMIRQLIVDHAPIPVTQVHPMPVEDPEGDVAYEQELRATLGQAGNRLDYVLLGMGPDGHTASLFPQTPGLSETGRWVVFNDGPLVAAPRPRMTMTYPLINTARRIAILITGQGKHAMLSRVASAGSSPAAVTELPITGIRPALPDTTLAWFLDEAAATGSAPPPKA